VRLHLHLDSAASHVLDHGVVLAAAAVEQDQGIARLQPEHLHVARGAGRQREMRTGVQGLGAVQARRHDRAPG
jgi:hypothetical protein